MVEPDVLTSLQRREQEGEGPQDVQGCHPNCNCERFVELWNLVFMQFYQDTQGDRIPLPAPSVDTGMGLERAAVILQDKTNIYETDLFRPIIEEAAKLSGKLYGEDIDDDFALRVVAEHTRAACFLIGDGVVPANEGRGYVLRRIIRRGIRYGRRLGLTNPFLNQVAELVLSGFGHVYRELEETRDFILRVLRLEEGRFGETMDRGLDILDGMISARGQHSALPREIIQFGEINRPKPDSAASIIAGYGWTEFVLGSQSPPQIGEQMAGQHLVVVYGDFLRELGENQPAHSVDGNEILNWPRKLSGYETFELYTTYGFPPELTGEIAREHGLEVDMGGFQREMEAHEERSRVDQAFSGSMEVQSAYESLGTEEARFVGYQGMFSETVVLAILAVESGEDLDSSTKSGRADAIGFAVQGQKVEVVLQDTPFYPEGGGQQGDQGTITGPNGVVEVTDTQSPIAGLIIHRGTVTQGGISLGDDIKAQVDVGNRLDASRNHSGTHLLHASLRSVLGPHVRQAGSLVTPAVSYTHLTLPTNREV